MRPRSIPLSPFGELLTALCARGDTTPTEAGERAGIRSAHSLMTYVTRPHADGDRRGVLSVKHIRALARVLKVSPEEEFRLVVLGCLEHAPPILGDYVRDLEQFADEMRQKAGKPVVRRFITDR